MNKGYWAGDSIATNLARVADNDRASRVLRQQQAYYCGALALQRAALAELERIDPQNTIFRPGVQTRIKSLGEAEMKRLGWNLGSSLIVDPAAVYTALLTEFEASRSAAIAAAEAEPVKHLRRGWFWARRDEFSWRKQIVNTREEGLALQSAEIVRLADSELGDAV